MDIGINKYYRQGLDLLRSVNGFEGVIKYKRQYHVMDENNQQISEPVDANQLYRQGLDSIRTNDFSKAKVNLNQAISVSPDNPNYHFAMSMAHYHCNEIQDAKKSIDEVVRIDPQYCNRDPNVQTIVQNISVMADNMESSAPVAVMADNMESSAPVTVMEEIPIRIHEETFEDIDLVESILRANGQYTMFELGAGYGRWIGKAVGVMRFLKLPLEANFTALEAEPGHYDFLLEHMANNNIPCNCIKAAVSDHDGTEYFKTGNPLTHYGQSLLKDGYQTDGIQPVQTYSLDTLLSGFDYVDFIDVDIQGAEGKVIAASKEISRKVRKIHIGTHEGSHIEGQTEVVEEQLRSVFDELNWINVWDFPNGTTMDTIFGPIEFLDGIQTWINPKFF